ncbi:hypothetical protein OIM90_17440 [Streptomyces sp. AD16]|nr:hypothetical protein SF12_01270 [Streptomyces sp. MBRL 601]WDV32439.1 hypothetical protein OIM90_17440 [Streptomyces sp. AD16]
MLRFFCGCFQGVGEAAGDSPMPVLSGDKFWQVADTVLAVAVEPDAVPMAELEVGGAMREDWSGDSTAVHAV